MSVTQEKRGLPWEGGRSLQKEDDKPWSQTDATSIRLFSYPPWTSMSLSTLGGDNKNKNNFLLESLQGSQTVFKALCKLQR